MNKIEQIAELWLPVVGYEGIYEVSNLGLVRSLDRRVCYKKSYRKIKGVILKNQIDKFGYPVVSILKSGKRKTKKIHRLVAEAFIPNPDRKQQVNHKDGIRSNCSLSNLEWCTPSENINHSYKTGIRCGVMKNKKGSLHNKSKSVSQYLLSGKLVDTFGSTREAQRKTGIQQSHISKCCRNKYKSAGGFVWKFN